MRIAISGASGYIGQHLSSFLEGKGYDVIPLGRDLFKEDCFDELCRCVESCEVVINLAGASINKRWTEAYKQELYDSRICVTRQLVHAINTRSVKLELFISVIIRLSGNMTSIMIAGEWIFWPGCVGRGRRKRPHAHRM